MNKFTSLFGLVFILLANFTFAQNTDLELTATLTSTSPKIYDTYSIDLVLTNKSDVAATDIVVNVPLPEGTVFQGGNEFTATTGIFFPSFLPEINNAWSLVELAAGESATLSLNYFLLTSDPIYHFAEVTALNETDEDSTPDNGNSPLVQEDDETVIELPLPQNVNCAIELTVNSLDCSDAGTSDLREDDVFTYTISATGEDTGSGFTLVAAGETVGVYEYDTEITLAGGLISEADSIELQIIDNSNRNCTATALVLPPRPCSADAPAEGVDLELMIEATNPEVLVFQSSIFLLTLNNVGTDTAKGVNVRFPMDLENDIVFVDAEFPVVSQGNYNPFGDDIWYVGTIPPGGTATVSADLYFLTKPFLYAEVVNLDSDDIDSRVANGNGISVNEDDEVVFGDQIGANCNIIVTVTDKICYDMGTTTPMDDLFIFSFTAYGENSSDTYRVIEPEGFPFEIAYGSEGQSLGTRLIADGAITLTVQDRANETCKTTVEIQPPAPCSAENIDFLSTTNSGLENGEARLFPTQVSERLTVEINTISSDLTMQIFNVQGQLVKSRNWQTTDGFNQQEINVNELPAGSYFVQLNSVDGQQTLRFVK
ncbi:MAG: T9SS type A sorting domain-containing protein [Saprospiraceae bacterium]